MTCNSALHATALVSWNLWAWRLIWHFPATCLSNGGRYYRSTTRLVAPILDTPEFEELFQGPTLGCAA